MTSKPHREPPMRIGSGVIQQIRQHARSSSKTEVCGVLLGDEIAGVTTIKACISGVNAAQGGAHVTFTQDTWGHIYKVKDRDYPHERILGWYHSHPGFGVFLSDHDTFIHKNFFSSPNQVAWVYDPLSDEEGCFGWKGGRIERLSQFAVLDGRGGEVAGGSGKPEPGAFGKNGADEVMEQALHEDDSDPELSRLARTATTLFSYLFFLLLGGVLAWYLFPRLVAIPVDPQTGRPLLEQRQSPAEGDSGRVSGASPKTSPGSGDPPSSSDSRDVKRDNAHQ